MPTKMMYTTVGLPDIAKEKVRIDLLLNTIEILSFSQFKTKILRDTGDKPIQG